MKMCTIFVLALVAAVSASEQEYWTQFKTKYGKMYRSSLEEVKRHSIFLDNLKKIEEHNEKYKIGNSSYEMGINEFADVTTEEFLEKLNYAKRSKPVVQASKDYFVYDANEDLPQTIDWGERGAVTGVKNQGNCGSCWSFSTTGTLEGQLFIKTGKLTSLSEQNLIDCAKSNCFGCLGGLMDKALEYVEGNGIMSEEDYPYEAEDGNCRFDASRTVTTISKYLYVKEGDEEELKAAVATVGPISVAVDATGFQFYKQGIYSESYLCGNDLYNLNHGVLVTGYGVSNGDTYWKVKNSWGASWGMDGYILISRNSNNLCGIATDPVYPEL